MVFKKSKFGDKLIEKRQFERYPSDLQIKIDTEDMPLDPVYVLIDIGLGGIAFKSSHKLKVAEIIWISIPADNPLFEGRGRVVWIKKVECIYQIGVKFIDLDDASLSSVMKFLQYVKSS